MAQIFHRGTNTIAKLSIICVVIGLPALSYALMGINLSYGAKRYIPISQPIQFSHKHHVYDVGLDCRFCHFTVDREQYAGMPATETCMTCHSQIWSDSPEVKPIYDSYTSGKPINWTRVHDLPDFVSFNHAIHINKGIGCVSCHGRVDRMPLVYKENTLTMGWCLDCHRNPERNIRPKDAIFKMDWKPSDVLDENGIPYTQEKLGAKLVKEYNIMPSKQLTDCSVCHY